MEEKRIRLKVHGVTNSQVQSGAYALVLAEEGLRRLPVIIGMFEAQSIAVAAEGIVTPRPLTHDLFVAYSEATGFKIKEIDIYNFEDGIFYARILIANRSKSVTIEARTSDAVAIALRTNSPIYTNSKVMSKCGVVIDESAAEEEEAERDTLPDEITLNEIKDMKKLTQQLKLLKSKDLEKRIEKAVQKENYEFAQILKDELLRREDEKGSKK